MKTPLDYLEKEAMELYNEQSGINYEITIQLSQAISLKRIADKLEVASKQPIMVNAKDLEMYKELWMNES